MGTTFKLIALYAFDDFAIALIKPFWTNLIENLCGKYFNWLLLQNYSYKKHNKPPTYTLKTPTNILLYLQAFRVFITFIDLKRDSSWETLDFMIFFINAHFWGVHVTCKYSFSRINPFNGNAHPSAKTCNHWSSTVLISREGKVRASDAAATRRLSGTNCSGSYNTGTCYHFHRKNFMLVITTSILCIIGGITFSVSKRSMIVCVDSRIETFSVFTIRSGCSGGSYRWVTPVNPWIDPSRAFLYKPLTSRDSHTDNGVST